MDLKSLKRKELQRKPPLPPMNLVSISDRWSSVRKMDLKSLKRKELQALCKKHGIPANSTNSQMIESLSSILEMVGTEGVRRNVKPILNEILSTRSLRSRVVVAEEDEELVTDQNLRRTQKRKSIVKKRRKLLL